MIVLRWAAGVLAMLCGIGVGVRMEADGVLLLGTVLFLLWLATFGVFTRGYWFGDDEMDARLAEVDEDLHQRGI